MFNAQRVRDRATHLRQLLGALARRPTDVRYVPRLLRSVGTNPLALRTPWLPFPLIDRLDANVSRDSKVFEFGGGGSTLFFADRAGQVVTVEHDADWYPLLQNATSSLANVELLERGPQNGYERYIGEIDRFPDSYFNFIIVDGRERVRCFRHAVQKLAPGGLLIIDDVDREAYREVYGVVDWPNETIVALAPFKPHFAHTSVFTRPLAEKVVGAS